MRLFLQEQKNG